MFRFATAALASCQSMLHVYDVLHCVKFVHVCLRGSGSLRHCFCAASQTKILLAFCSAPFTLVAELNPVRWLQLLPCTIRAPCTVRFFDPHACSLCSSAPSPNSMLKSERRSFDRPCESEKINIEMGGWGDAAPRQFFPACRHVRERYDIHSIIRRTFAFGMKIQRYNFNVHHSLMLPLLS